MHHFLFLAHWRLRKTIGSNTTISSRTSVSQRAETPASWCVAMAACTVKKVFCKYHWFWIYLRIITVHHKLVLIFVALANYSCCSVPYRQEQHWYWMTLPCAVYAHCQCSVPVQEVMCSLFSEAERSSVDVVLVADNVVLSTGTWQFMPCHNLTINPFFFFFQSASCHTPSSHQMPSNFPSFPSHSHTYF